MIFDRLSNSVQYEKLGEKIKKGFDFLKNNDLKNFQDGRYIIEGDENEPEIYANIQTLTTKKEEEKKWEVHRKYIDIQYVIEGEEKMGFGVLEGFKEVTVKYDETKDIEFLEGKKYSFVKLQQGDFAVFFPSDVHAPMLAVNDPCEIKKVIVKIKCA